MTATTLTQATASCEIHEKPGRTLDPFFEEFDATIRRTAAFHAIFFLLGIAEIVLFFSFFFFLATSMLLALSLAGIFFTFFTYFTLRTYFQAKKPHQMRELKETFAQGYRTQCGYHAGTPAHHVSLANAYCKLANKLHCREYQYYPPPPGFKTLAPLAERFSCWCHWQDIHFMRELLLQGAVDEHIQLVKYHPISLEAHAALANAYVMLSGIYIDPRKIEGYDDDRWIPPEKYGSHCEVTFRDVAERAIEEFKILSDYAPDDPWVHTQLAYSFHDLQMPLEEIEEYEIIRRLAPDDLDTLYKLGVLYFQQGLNGRGLRVYEELKRRHYARADHLIAHYGALKA